MTKIPILNTTHPPRFRNLSHSLLWRSNDFRNNARLERLGRDVAKHAPDPSGAPPVVVFRATSGLLRLDQNAAFSLLTAWSLRLSGVPVVHFACRAGMSRCVLGVDREDYSRPPPCRDCVAQSTRSFTGGDIRWFELEAESELRRSLEGLDLPALSEFEFQGLPLGQLALPSIRWTLRRHNLPDDPPTRFLYGEFILSAFNVARHFGRLLEQVRPAAVMVFNGTFYPEATARWISHQQGLRVITHEVGMRPYTGFFTEGEATAYPIRIPDDFQLGPEQEARLDAYLENRFRGNFSMAGIRFWPEMQSLDGGLRAKMARFEQVVPVFTNVVFDTSQVHANTSFSDMFSWLESILALIRDHPETLFVIRAHPDEKREHKQSRESVSDWIGKNRVGELPNAVFIDSEEYLSSYELIQASKFVMVYNSSIGLEASLMGAAVLCGGKARYTQTPCVFFPQGQDEYLQQARAFLAADSIEVPTEFSANARRFLYYQLYKVSLPFEDFLEAHALPGFVKLKRFEWQAMLPENSTSLRTIVEGITGGGPFVLDE
ncbi:MAG: hypothetical protein R3335_04675 [Anaerolineales bacterium]|nr:hypothetical protein [Anaerolineales bacterium]